MSQQIEKQLPYLLTREQASKFLGIDPKSFDKYIRYHDQLERFMIGRHERYTVASLIKFIEEHAYRTTTFAEFFENWIYLVKKNDVRETTFQTMFALQQL